MNNFKIQKLTPVMGVEIIALDLSQNLRKHILDKIFKLLIKRKVIFFRNQKI